MCQGVTTASPAGPLWEPPHWTPWSTHVNPDNLLPSSQSSLLRLQTRLLSSLTSSLQWLPTGFRIRFSTSCHPTEPTLTQPPIYCSKLAFCRHLSFSSGSKHTGLRPIPPTCQVLCRLSDFALAFLSAQRSAFWPIGAFSPFSSDVISESRLQTLSLSVTLCLIAVFILFKRVIMNRNYLIFLILYLPN